MGNETKDQAKVQTGKAVEAKALKPEQEKHDDSRKAQLDKGVWMNGADVPIPLPQPSAHALAFDKLTADVREAREKTNAAGRIYAELFKEQKELEFKLNNFVVSRMGTADPIRVAQ